MGKYSKLYSNYIFRKKHGNITGGTLYERDWVTTGERHVLEPGKKPYSGSGGFIFTDNSIAESLKKHKYGKWVDHFVYDDVKNSSESVNKVLVNYKSKDIRDFAYYGSAVEMLRVSLEDIAREFPGKVDVTNKVYTYFDEHSTSYVEIPFPGGHLYEISNPFAIDLSKKDVVIEKYDNALRFMTYSWAKYVVEDNTKDYGRQPFAITGYEVVWNDNPQTEGLEKYVIGGVEYIKYGCFYYKYNRETNRYDQIRFADENNYFVRCNEYVMHNDEYYQWSSTENCYKPIPVVEVCPEDGTVIVKIDISAEFEYGTTLETKEYSIYGILMGGSIVYVSPNSGITIRPDDDVIEEYFSGLEGFERTLLNRDSNPVFRNTFVTPVIGEDGNYKYVDKTYTLPSDGYCVNMTSTAYDLFVKELSETCSLFDELWTDNIWRNMTHESIKNFDWTYSREYVEGDEAYNIEGGIRMEKIVRIYGRIFDDIKRHVDGIRMSIAVTYDGYNNLPDAEISDRIDTMGWDVYSTIWMPYEYYEESHSNVSPDETIVRLQQAPSFVDVDSPELITIGCDSDSGDDAILRKKALPADDFIITESYAESIGKDSGWLDSNHNGFVYELIRPEDIPSSYPISEHVYVDKPKPVTTTSPDYIGVTGNGNTCYYKKVAYETKDKYKHSTWYASMSCEKVTPSSCDIDFNRRLFLSAKHILRTKGTINSLEMVFGLFGLGKDVDYKLTEVYHTIRPKFYDAKFYWYRPLGTTAPEGEHFGPANTYETVPKLVTAYSSLYIRVGDGTGTYDYYVKDGSMTVWEAMEYINSRKGLSLVYDKTNSGIPVSDIMIGKDHLVVPYFNAGEFYDGNPMFHGKGGWCKKSTSSIAYDYDETLSYMHMFKDISAMLGVGYNDIREGEIVYVHRIADYASSAVYHGAVMSNYFKLVDRYFPERIESWRNIPMSGSIIYDDYVPADPDVTHADYLLAKHLDSLVSINIGNNPHGGYGEYDGGMEYLDYVETPFKYSIDNDYFSDSETEEMARQFSFGVSGKITDNDKVKLLDCSEEYVPATAEEVLFVDWNELNTYPSMPSEVYNSSPAYIRVGYGQSYSYYKKVVRYVPNDAYFINSKVLYVTNLLDSNLYRSYFMNVILKYLVQVIPSTTIMILDGYNVCDGTHETETKVLSASVNDETMGYVLGGGVYGKCDDVAVQAFANDGFHFAYWTDENGYIISMEERYVFRILEDTSLTAIFEQD